MSVIAFFVLILFFIFIFLIYFDVGVVYDRESIYRLLPQTTAENISKNFEQYTIDPATRYPNLNSTCVRPHQVRHLYINGDQNSSCSLERSGPTRRSVSLSRKGKKGYSMLSTLTDW